MSERKRFKGNQFMIDKVMDVADEAFYSDSRLKRPNISEQKERLLKAQDKRERKNTKRSLQSYVASCQGCGSTNEIHKVGCDS